jgi:hypothetical protein
VDLKSTLNPNLSVDHHPHPDDTFASLSNGKLCSVLDLSEAYVELKLNMDSQYLLTVNTYLRLFRYEARLLNNETAFAASELLSAAPNCMHGY